MLFNKRLKRKELVSIMQKFYKTFEMEKKQEKKKYLLSNLLIDLENKLNKNELKPDENFFTYDRRDFLRREFTDKLNKKNIRLNNNYLIDAYFNLYDYASNATWISAGSVPNNISVQEIIKKDEQYRESGFICLQEKEILLEMIQELKEAIENDREEEALVNNTKKINETIDIDVICPYCNSNDIWRYLYGEPTYDYDRDKYILGGCEIDFTKTYKCKNCNKDFK